MALFPALALGATACGDQLTDLSVAAPGTTSQAVIADFSPTIDNAIINEGDTLTVTMALCVDNNTEAATVSVQNWADGSTPVAADSLTVGTAAFIAGDGTNGCATGQFKVCGAGATECVFTHVYADDTRGAQVIVQTRAVQGGDTQNQGIALTVNNVAPTVEAVVRTGATTEGSVQSILFRVSDPGLLATELSTVTIDVAPAATAFPALTITCECDGTGWSCNDFEATTVNGACNDANVTVRSRWLDNSPPDFVISARVTDKETATDSLTTSATPISNQPPTSPVISLTDQDADRGDSPAQYNGLTLSTTGDTAVREGQQYKVDFRFSDVGTDRLTWSWNFANGEQAQGPFSGNVLLPSPLLALGDALVLDPATPAAQLTDLFAWDQAFTNPDVTFALADDDLGNADAIRGITVEDVDPIIDSFVQSSATVSEGGSVTYTVAAIAGDFGSGFDAIGSNAQNESFVWRIRDDGDEGFDRVALGGVAGFYAVASGCGPSDTSCQLTYLDADVSREVDILVEVRDEDSTTSSNRLTTTVSNVAVAITSFTVTSGGVAVSPAVGINEAASVNVDVTIADPAGALDGTYTLSVDYGDNDALNTATTTTLVAPGAFATQSQRFADNKNCDIQSSDTVGTCVITVQACEVGGTICATSTFNLLVNNVAPSASATSANGGLEIVEGTSFALVGTYNDPGDNNDNDYDFDWRWNDGTTPVAVTGTSQFATRGVNLNQQAPGFVNVPLSGLSGVVITLGVDDFDGGRGTSTVNVNVRDNKPQVVSVTEVPAVNANEPRAVTEINVQFRAETNADLITSLVVNWGDGTIRTYRDDCGNLLNCIVVANITGATASGNTVTLAKPNAYADSDGDPATTGTTDPFTVTVVANDEDSASDPVSIEVDVNNVAPTFVSFNPDPRAAAIVVSEGQPAAFVITATDAAAADRPGMILAVDWGDGSDTEEFTVSALSGSNVIFRAAHVYNSPDNFTVAFVIRDKEGADTAERGTVEVVNLAPVLSDVFVTQPAFEGVEVSALAVVDNRGADTLSYRFDFECNGDAEGTLGQGPQLGDQASGTARFTYNNEGTNTVCVRVCDDDNANNSCAFGAATITVQNQPAALSLTANTPVANEGDTVTLTATATESNTADTFDLTFDCGNGAPLTTVSDVASGVATNQACVYGDNGSFSARVIADDGAEITERTVAISIRNVAPSIAAAVFTATTVGEGQSTQLTVSGAVDPAGPNDILTVQYDINNDGAFDLFSNAPNGATAFRFPTDGDNVWTARVCDEDGGCSATSAPQNALVNNTPPEILALNAPAAVTVGNAATFSVAAIDAGNDALTYTFEVTRAGTIVATVGPQSSPAASITTRNTGLHTVNVTVTDKANAPATAGTATDTTTFDVVEGANENPSITQFTASPNVVNEGLANTVVLTAVASDLGGDDLTFTFDCNDDGTADATVGPQAPGTATGNCAYDDNGTFLARVTVRDDDGGFATSQTVVTVRNVAPTLGAVVIAPVNEGQVSNLTVTGSSDPGDDTITIQYDLNNDGAFEVSSSAPNGAASFRFTTDGNNAIKVRACDEDGGCSAPTDAVAVVNNLAPVVNNVNVASTATVGSPVSVNVSATDAGNDALSYRYSFFLNGSATPQEVVGPISSPSATVTFGASGTYRVDVEVTDTANATGSGTAGFVVTEVNVAVVASASPQTINEGGTTTITAIPRGTGPFLASFDVNADGDFDDVAAGDVRDLACDGDAINPCRIDATYPQNRNGDLAFRVLVSVADTGASNSVETAIVAVDVKNVAPTVDTVDDATIVEGTLFEDVLTAQDPGVQDTLRFSLVSGPNGLSVNEAGALSWTPNFNDEGENEVVVRVTDSDNASGTETFVLTVTIIDENNNGVADARELELNGGNLFPPDADQTDTDADGINDLEELLAGTNPNSSDAPRAPVIISPDNGLKVNTATPSLTVANSFSPRRLPLTYTFTVFDSADAEVLVISDVAEGGTTTTAVVPTALTEGGSFTWSAFANDGLVDGTVSVRGSFTVNAENAAPGAPNALTPVDGAAFSEGSVVGLEVSAVLDPDGDDVDYTFEIATDAAFATIVVTSSARDVPFFTSSEALAAGQYFWHAKASDGVLESAFGTSASFTITEVVNNAAPTAPAIVSPSNETLDTNAATLTITAGTDPDGDTLSYEFELATNAAFANATASGVTADLTFAVSGLAEDTQHFWRARSNDGALVSDWVNATFVVNAQNAAPTGLAILSPADGALLQSAPAAFLATEARDAEGDDLTYTVVLSESEDLSSPLATAAAAVVDGVVTLEAPAGVTLEAGKTYFWQVTATDGDGETKASASFTLFKPQVIPDPEPEVSGGGCGCAQNEANPMANLAGLALLGLALARRRRLARR